MNKTAGKIPDNPAPHHTPEPAIAVDENNGHAENICPIIGIGSSAGGLEALEQFLSNMPAKSGFATVIVQHLDPTHKDMMVELLQRSTIMPVVQITDSMIVEPDHVYVIPPNKDLSILHGILHLFDPITPRGLRLPIDFFFRSLADDRQEKSIGVILSGMGSDGTLGLRAIKEKAGVAFVQSPGSAKFDSMPRSVMNAGLADVVASAEVLPGKIISHFQHIPRLLQRDNDAEKKDQSGLEKIVILLRSQTGHDFSQYKQTTIYRRIERRMGLHQLTKIGDYVRYLQENLHETELLFKELLIGVTNFFRDPDVWEQWKAEVVPARLAAYPNGGVLRAWIPGCSTGEEAYTFAIIFKEAIDEIKPAGNYTLQIFATDLDKDAINRARAGVYPSNIAADVTEERLRRFFIKEDTGFRVSKETRGMVTFAPQDLIMDPPFTRLDFLSCRNLLIYLMPDVQKKLMLLFHYSLKKDGFLLLGNSETIGNINDLFNPLPGKSRIFRRLDTAQRKDLIEFPTTFTQSSSNKEVPESTQPYPARPEPTFQSLADQQLLQHYTPAAVFVTEQGDILYISGKTGKYLEPAAGKLTGISS